MIFKVALEPELSGPTFQTPLAYVVPSGTVAETKVIPAGNRSVTVAPLALLQPVALLTVTVKVTLLPKFGLALSTVLVSERSIAGEPRRFTPSLSALNSRF